MIHKLIILRVLLTFGRFMAADCPTNLLIGWMSNKGLIVNNLVTSLSQICKKPLFERKCDSFMRQMMFFRAHGHGAGEPHRDSPNHRCSSNPTKPQARVSEAS